MRIGLLITAALAASIPFATHAAEDISGTYKLVVDQRKIVETGEIIRGASPQGYISYGKDGRLFVIIVRQPRPRPENSDTVTDQQRIDLYRTMSAYGGT